MKLIKGANLTPDMAQQVKSAFIYRHTAIGPGKYYGNEQAWLEDHAFYFTKNGKLSRKHKFCEPHYMAN